MAEGQPARARRVGPTAADLNAATLDGTLTLSRRVHDKDFARRRRDKTAPSGPEPLATTGLVFGVIAVLAGCAWPLSGAAGLVAIVSGVAGLNGRSRPRAVAAVTLGVVGGAAGLGVAVASMAIVVQKNAPPPPVVPAPQPEVFFPE